MPNGQVHRRVGRPVGAAAAFVCARDQEAWHLLLETLGGVVAGGVGGQLPDLFDPPTHGYHRSLGHGLVPSVAAGRFLAKQIPAWQRALRAEADRHAARWHNGASGSEAVAAFLGELLCRLLAGALPGVIAGYASHLALDLGTPRRLPLLG